MHRSSTSPLTSSEGSRQPRSSAGAALGRSLLSLPHRLRLGERASCPAPQQTCWPSCHVNRIHSSIEKRNLYQKLIWKKSCKLNPGQNSDTFIYDHMACKATYRLLNVLEDMFFTQFEFIHTQNNPSWAQSEWITRLWNNPENAQNTGFAFTTDLLLYLEL